MYWYWFIFNCSYGTLNYSSIHVVSQEMHPSFNLTFTSVMMSKLCVYSCSDTRVVQESCQCCVPVMRMDAAHAALCVCIAICAQGNPLKHILALTWIRCVGSPICMNQYVRDILGTARRVSLLLRLCLGLESAELSICMGLEMTSHLRT